MVTCAGSCTIFLAQVGWREGAGRADITLANLQVEGGRCYIPGFVSTAPHPGSDFALGSENLGYFHWQCWAMEFRHNQEQQAKLLALFKVQPQKLSSCCRTWASQWQTKFPQHWLLQSPHSSRSIISLSLKEHQSLKPGTSTCLLFCHCSESQNLKT